MLLVAARNLFVYYGAPNVQQLTVVNAGWAGAFTVSAGQAAVEVELSFSAWRLAFQCLFYQVDAAARPIQFVAE